MLPGNVNCFLRPPLKAGERSGDVFQLSKINILAAVLKTCSQREGRSRWSFRGTRNCKATVCLDIFFICLRAPIKYVYSCSVQCSTKRNEGENIQLCRIYHTWERLTQIFYPVSFWNNAVFVWFSWINRYLEFIDQSGPPPTIHLTTPRSFAHVHIAEMADTWCCLKSINEAGKNKCLEFGIIINCMLLFGNLKRALFEKVWPIDKNVTEGGDVLQSIFRPSMLSIIINEFMCADMCRYHRPYGSAAIQLRRNVSFFQ